MKKLTKQQKNLLKDYPRGSDRIEMVRIARVELGDEQAEVLRSVCDLHPCPECGGKSEDPWSTHFAVCWFCYGSGIASAKRIEMLKDVKAS